MGIIITGMDMPKNCMSCELKNISGGCIAGSNVHSNYDKQFKDCHLKSIDGLIKEIKNIDLDKTINDFYGMQKKVIEVIEEYCEVKK